MHLFELIVAYADFLLAQCNERNFFLRAHLKVLSKVAFENFYPTILLNSNSKQFHFS